VYYYLRVLEDSKYSTAKMSLDKQIGSNKDSDATISNNGEETSEGEIHSRELETATDVFKDARRLFL
jgi:hypothetical protein